MIKKIFSLFRYEINIFLISHLGALWGEPCGRSPVGGALWGSPVGEPCGHDVNILQGYSSVASEDQEATRSVGQTSAMFSKKILAQWAKTKISLCNVHCVPIRQCLFRKKFRKRKIIFFFECFEDKVTKKTKNSKKMLVKSIIL